MAGTKVTLKKDKLIKKIQFQCWFKIFFCYLKVRNRNTQQVRKIIRKEKKNGFWNNYVPKASVNGQRQVSMDKLEICQEIMITYSETRSAWVKQRRQLLIAILKVTVKLFNGWKSSLMQERGRRNVTAGGFSSAEHQLLQQAASTDE